MICIHFAFRLFNKAILFQVTPSISVRNLKPKHRNDNLKTSGPTPPNLPETSGSLLINSIYQKINTKCCPKDISL